MSDDRLPELGSIVHVEYPGLFEGARAAIVTRAARSDFARQRVVNVHVFGVSGPRGDRNRDFDDVMFVENDDPSIPDIEGPFAYFPAPAVEPEENADGEA